MPLAVLPYFLLLIVGVGAGGYYYVTDLQRDLENAKAMNTALVERDKQQKEAIAQIQADFELQTKQLNEVNVKFQEAEVEARRYLDIFKRHNLNKLATAKPGMIESRANKATKAVFDAIEADSNFVDNLDDN